VTMTSTGTKALYLSPTNALHGDIGMITDKDILVLVSKSGESEELLNFIPFLRNRGVYMIALVSNPSSRLAKSCDFVMNLPLERELCPFDLVPTTSTTVQMIFGDMLAVALMNLKNYSLDKYALNHPAGRIGKRTMVKVKDLMLVGTDIPFCSTKNNLRTTLVELSNKRCGCVLIVDENRHLLGIFTDGDLRRALQSRGANVLEIAMDQLMTKTARWIGPDDLAWVAMQKMESDQKNAITVLPVIDDEKKVVGLIKMHDIVQAGI
jgi:arabinose-5-phosphate isomerase